MKWSVISFVLLVLASCQHREERLDPTLEGFFPADTGEGRSPGRFAGAQAASGARADGTLSNHHFDGRGLNSLGADKLSRMVRDDDAAEPMRIYLNLDERAAESKGRRDAVVAFLRDAGLAEGQVEVVYGRNPESWSRSSTHLSNLRKTETGDAAGAAPTDESESTGAAGPKQGNDAGLGALNSIGAGSLFKK